MTDVEGVFLVDGERAVPTEIARGPWSPHALHGGAPAALLARAVERHDPGPADFVARLTIELLRPVPFAPLDVQVNTFRPGRKVQWLEAGLFADGTEVARAVALRVRTDPSLALPVGALPPRSLPGPDESDPFESTFEERGWGARVDTGFWHAFEFRMAHGSFGAAGPAGMWFRLTCPIVAGEDPSPLQRVAAAADFGNGVSALFDDGVHTFINADLTVSLLRLPAGGWVGLDSVSTGVAAGVGLAESTLLDEDGRIGRSVQTLVLDRA